MHLAALIALVALDRFVPTTQDPRLPATPFRSQPLVAPLLLIFA